MSIRFGPTDARLEGPAMRIARIACLFVTTCFIQGSYISCRQEQPVACGEFFALSVEERERAFPSFPLDRQLEIFRCGMNRRPPTIALAYDIAKGGEKIIPQL